MHLINIIDTTCKLFYFRIFEPYRILKRTKKQKMTLGCLLWLILIFVLCCGASGCLGFVLIIITVGILITVWLGLKGKLND